MKRPRAVSRTLGVTALAAGCILGTAWQAAGDRDTDVGSGAGSFDVWGDAGTGGETYAETRSEGSTNGARAPEVVDPVQAWADNINAHTCLPIAGLASPCIAPVACGDGELNAVPAGWLLGGASAVRSECEAPAAAAPVITPALVLQAFQSVPLPETVLTIQPPDGLTLVNFDTNFYTEAAPFTTTVTLLGQAVELDITPTSYTWAYGDGTTATTSTPGAPYPDLEVTHRYQQTGSYQVTVTTTWSARYRVNGGPWLDVAGTVTMPSAPVPLQVDEATPILTD